MQVLFLRILQRLLCCSNIKLPLDLQLQYNAVKKNREGIINRVVIVCHCAGVSEGKITAKTGCPWKVTIRHTKERGCHFLDPDNLEHNHDPSEHALGSSKLRLLIQRQFGPSEIRNLVEERSKNVKNTSREIASQLQAEHEGLMITATEVRRIQLHLRETKYGPFSSTQAFIQMLETDDDIAYHAFERSLETGKIWRVFWVYKQSIEDWKRHPYLLMMDCTYKVNRFNMPLLQITGTTAFHSNFSVGFGLVSHEATAAFTWLATHLKLAADEARISMPDVIITDYDLPLKNALREAFPAVQQQPCLWHIMKNVILNIKRKWNGSLDDCEIVGYAKEDVETRKVATAAVERLKNDEVDDNEALTQAVQDAIDNAFELSRRALEGTSIPEHLPNKRKYLPTANGIKDAWMDVVWAVTKDDFEKSWKRLQDEFPDQDEIIKYLDQYYIPFSPQFAEYSNSMNA